ncbi:MAG TPA: KH domain-containing protein [Ignavibacteriaceae bacterium]|jgi:predicted RNA-binding protein YlqC (UPF0109 family)|nr:KH domain-containing protein [Ignavibacteriaceae bacterium]
MKEFIEFIIRHLVDKPEKISINMKTLSDNRLLFSLKVAREDMGKVIGRQGKTAEAIRVLLTAISSKEGKKAVLEILG